jgi:hypothetical protein
MICNQINITETASGRMDRLGSGLAIRVFRVDDFVLNSRTVHYSM